MPDAEMDPRFLSAAAASSVVLTADTFSQTVAPDYWTWSQDAHRAVVRALAGLPDPRVRELTSLLLRQPADASVYWQLSDAIAAYLEQPARVVPGRLAGLIREAGRRSRLWINPGDGCPADATAHRPGELLSLIRRAPHRHRRRVDAAVVIPFRGCDQDGDRVRNLAAALNALSDQSHPRERYRIVVAESDTAPRWRDLLTPACDVYLFAPCPVRFNKSWTVNIGVVHGGRPADLICVLDADVLVDRDFVRRAVARFAKPGPPAHWPFQDMLYLDDQSSRRAVAARCVQDMPRLDHGPLRGVYLRRPPGACVWLREPMFTRIGGMDERFCGWGGEDQDFAWRIESHEPLDRHCDPMVHLNHRRAPHRDDNGLPFHAEIRFCSWPSDSAIGDPGKYDRQQLKDWTGA